MADEAQVRKIRERIARGEAKIQAQISEVERLWEDTGLDPKDPSYLVEKTMRFEMAHSSIAKAFLLFRETIEDYKRLCSEMEKSGDSH